MQLSKRMQRLASLVTEGNRLADVGTDHAYIPIALVREGRIPFALAMDVNQGPLSRAREHIRSSGLDTYIEIRLSDGLEKLKAEEADTVLIAGMGGMLTVRILEGGVHCLHAVRELILQPQSDIQEVRRWLYGHGYRIVEEDVAEEDGKYYPMMKAVRGQEEIPQEAELYYGNVEIQRSPDILYACLLGQLTRKQKVMESLRRCGKEDTKRAREMECDMERIRYQMRRLRAAREGEEVFPV